MMPPSVFIFVLALAVVTGATGVFAEMVPQPTVNNCTLHFQTQFLDHFSWNETTFQQRYFKYDKWYKPGGPIFFYNGNEANVEVFANWTGLMWENGEAQNALLIFAEHRYYGDSLPCPGGFMECGNYLSTEQAMADYAALITDLRVEYPDAGVAVTFGGSYGGMLAAWMRMRYPGVVGGAIASSAPIGCMASTYNKDSYWQVVSRDATPAGGAVDGCNATVHQAFEDIQTLLSQPSGGAAVQSALRLCRAPSAQDFNAVGYFVQAAFDAMAMGNYPFPTYYIAGTPGNPAPAWPMRVACQKMTSGNPTTATARLENLHAAISVINNISGDALCYDTNQHSKSVFSPIWDFMVCTSGLINEQPYFPARGPPYDMFYQQPAWPPAKMKAYCEKTYGKAPRDQELWMGLGLNAIPSSSNIIFANGLLDPWHSGGILTNLSASILAPIIPEGAHHLDLFFSTPNDPPHVAAVRALQMENIDQWQAAAKQSGLGVHNEETAASSHPRASFRRVSAERKPHRG